MPGFVGLPEILLLGLVVLLVFGPKRLPEMGKSLGKGMREFKTSVSGMTDMTPVIKADVAPTHAVEVVDDLTPAEVHPITGEPVAVR